MKYAHLLVLSMLAIGCGDDGGTSGTIDAPSIDAPPGQIDAAIDAPAGGAFTLTSATITEGQPFPLVHTCDGANTSPALAWAGAPAGTMSFAIVLTDKSNNLVHSVIYDIPSTATGVPENVQKAYAPANVPGAHQTTTLGGGRGYAGPCPNPQDGPHTYEFALFAINAATLPGAMMATNRLQAVALINDNDIATTLLTGTHDRN